MVSVAPATADVVFAAALAFELLLFALLAFALFAALAFAEVAAGCVADCADATDGDSIAPTATVALRMSDNEGRISMNMARVGTEA